MLASRPELKAFHLKTSSKVSGASFSHTAGRLTKSLVPRRRGLFPVLAAIVLYNTVVAYHARTVSLWVSKIPRSWSPRTEVVLRYLWDGSALPCINAQHLGLLLARLQLYLQHDPRNLFVRDNLSCLSSPVRALLLHQ